MLPELTKGKLYNVLSYKDKNRSFRMFTFRNVVDDFPHRPMVIASIGVEIPRHFCDDSEGKTHAKAIDIQ